MTKRTQLTGEQVDLVKEVLAERVWNPSKNRGVFRNPQLEERLHGSLPYNGLGELFGLYESYRTPRLDSDGRIDERDKQASTRFIMALGEGIVGGSILPNLAENYAQIAILYASDYHGLENVAQTFQHLLDSPPHAKKYLENLEECSQKAKESIEDKDSWWFKSVLKQVKYGFSPTKQRNIPSKSDFKLNTQKFRRTNVMAAAYLKTNFPASIGRSVLSFLDIGDPEVETIYNRIKEELVYKGKTLRWFPAFGWVDPDKSDAQILKEIKESSRGCPWKGLIA